MRGFLGGLWSHTLFTALAGAGVGFFVARRDRPVWQRTVVAVVLFVVAAGFHFLWNSPLLAGGVDLGLLGSEPRCVLVKGIPALLVGVVLLVAAERRQADYYAGLLAGLGDPRIATADEIRALVSPRRRRRRPTPSPLRLGWPAPERCDGCSGPRPTWPSRSHGIPEPKYCAGGETCSAAGISCSHCRCTGADRPQCGYGEAAPPRLPLARRSRVGLVALGLALAIRDLT